jgi:hypothetical protein
MIKISEKNSYIAIAGCFRGERDAAFFGLLGTRNPLQIAAHLLVQ